MAVTPAATYPGIHRDIGDGFDHAAQAVDTFTRPVENIKEKTRIFLAELLDFEHPSNWRQRFWNKLAYTGIHGLDMAVELALLQWTKYGKNVLVHTLWLLSAIPHLNARKAKAAGLGIRHTFGDLASDLIMKPYNIWRRWEMTPLRTRWRRAYNADGTTPPPPPPPPAPAAP